MNTTIFNSTRFVCVEIKTNYTQNEKYDTIIKDIYRS